LSSKTARLHGPVRAAFFFALVYCIIYTAFNSQRQLPADQDYAVSTREYQTDQSSLKPAPAAAGPVLEKRQKQQQRQKQPHRCAAVDRVTPYQSGSRIHVPFRGWRKVAFTSTPQTKTCLWGPRLRKMPLGSSGSGVQQFWNRCRRFLLQIPPDCSAASVFSSIFPLDFRFLHESQGASDFDRGWL
jgi:hypothetical protein